MSNKRLTKSGGMPAVTEEDIEQRLAQMRLAAIQSEERVIRGGCAATGGTYLLFLGVWSVFVPPRGLQDKSFHGAP